MCPLYFHSMSMKRNTGTAKKLLRLPAVILLVAFCLLFGPQGNAGPAGSQAAGESSREARAFVSTGNVQFQSGNNKQAKVSYEKAFELFEKAGDGPGKGDALRGLAGINARTCDYALAWDQLDKAFAYYEKAHSAAGVANTYLGMADLHLKLREFKKAEAMYRKARSIYRELHEDVGEANVLYGMGQIYLKVGNIPQAMKMYEKALAVYEKKEHLVGQGNVCQSMGAIYFYRGDNGRARDLLHKALAFFRRAGDPVGQGYVHRLLGLISMRTGDSKDAAEQYNSALAGYLKAEDVLGQADVCKGIGDLSFYTRDFVRAMEMYDRALPSYLKAREPVGQGNVYRSMGDIYFFTGDNEKALEMYGRAADLYEKADSPIGQGNAYRSIGDVYFVKRDFSRSIIMQERAIPLFEKGNSAIGLGDAYRSLGDDYLMAGHHEKALAMYTRSLPNYSEARSSIGMGNVYQSIGDSNLYLKDLKKAMESYNTALDYYRKLGDIESEAFVLFKIAGIHAGNGSREFALRLYEEGLSRLERVRRQTGFSELKKSYMAKVYDLYNDAAVFMIENGFKEKAFRYVEAMKARVFLDQLSEGLVDLEKGIDPALKEKRDVLERKIALLDSQVLDETQKPAYDPAVLASMRKEKERAEEELDGMRREIRYRNPLYASVQYPEPIALQTLQRKVLAKNEVLIAYFLSGKGVYCFVVRAEGYELVRLPVEQAALERRVRDLLGKIREGGMLGSPYPAEDAARLYEALVQPVEPLLAGRDVILVPDGVLALLPFEALITKGREGRIYLIEKYSLKYVQSASVLGILRTQYKKEGTTSWFIGFGDPVYDYKNFKEGRPEGSDNAGGDKGGKARSLTRSGYLRSGGSLSRLEGSGLEVAEIENIFKKRSKQAKSLLRAEAREEEVKSGGLESYGFVHFSTHGIVDDSFQAIALSQIPESKEDGFFTLGEIMNSRFNAQLVTLSACETGLGKSDRGEGVTGLTRAVMYAGSPAAVVSLWPVSDEGTRELMVLFYKNMIDGGMTKDAALRKAKIRLIKARSHPFFWAAFVMYGE